MFKNVVEYILQIDSFIMEIIHGKTLTKQHLVDINNDYLIKYWYRNSLGKKRKNLMRGCYNSMVNGK